MASVSGTSSLGNTSLRGFGGMASGIDRDAMIDQMTLGTQTKISSQKKAMTSLQWKQEAYQGISNKLLELQDNYFSYASGFNLKDPSVFAKNQITALGDKDVTKYVTATGTSDMVDYLSILGVKKLATRASLHSDSKGDGEPIVTGITGSSLTDIVYKTSNLKGTQLKFGTYNTDGSFKEAGTFTFPSSYKVTDADGKEQTVDIDYTAEPEVLAEQLNKALEQSSFKLGENGKIKFEYDAVNDKMVMNAEGDAGNFVIRDTSSALGALGFDLSKLTENQKKNGITFEDFNKNENRTSFKDAYITRKNMVQYLTGKSMTVSYGGQTKQIDLIKSGDSVSSLDDLKTLLQGRLDKAFGTNKINVDIDPATDGLTFNSVDPKQALTINSDDSEFRKTIGIPRNASNKLSMDDSLKNNLDKLGIPAGDQQQFLEDLERDGLVINGVTIKGVTANSSLNDVISKINNTKDVGVKASYMSGSNQFALVASETGSGRDITLNGVAEKLFGTTNPDNARDGEDAEIEVSYGNGITTTINSSSNTFNLEGLNITVSGTFGYKLDSDGNSTGVLDPSQAVTFNAKADVDGVTEKVKEFIESYNEMITEINKQITTRSDSSYGPLTDEQKEEMSEKSIENWEKKAKEGLLFNNASMRALSSDLQAVFTKMMGSGMSYEDLEKMGFSTSDDVKDGGTIVFDEAKFKAAMGSEPEKVSDLFTGGGDVKKGFAQIVEDTLTPYATRYPTRNGSSYGRLIEEAGSEKLPLSVMKNQMYEQFTQMQERLAKLQSQLYSEEDRYIRQFSAMETMISQMNSQSSWLSGM